jgi:serine phosphatase RsbU (regulator of sigma subunit)
VLLADVSGHGAQVSKLALGLRDLMRRNVNVVKQTRFVEGMNRQFTELSQSGAFATALVATFFQPTSRLTFCNAGHPDPLFYDASRGIWSSLEQPAVDSEHVTGTPLGVHDQARYPQFEMVLERGDLILFFSDAVTESLDADGGMLGMDGLLRLIAPLDAASPAELLPRLLSALRSCHPDNSLVHDDLTLVLLEATGTSTKLVDNLLALFRLLGPVGDSTKLG